MVHQKVTTGDDTAVLLKEKKKEFQLTGHWSTHGKPFNLRNILVSQKITAYLNRTTLMNLSCI